MNFFRKHKILLFVVVALGFAVGIIVNGYQGEGFERFNIGSHGQRSYPSILIAVVVFPLAWVLFKVVSLMRIARDQNKWKRVRNEILEKRSQGVPDNK